ncbi:MAG: hypothetical protein Q8R42_01715 [Desulfocapsaceae bacterium]|nr:hypothetical protein [Desulfocapsaceae bacterium]
MNILLKSLQIFTVFFLLTMTGCAHRDAGPSPISNTATVYIPTRGSSLLARFAPVFLVDDDHIPHNRIGTPIAQKDQEGTVHISIDPDQPALYGQQFPFQTAKETYTNLIYRIHFQETPSTLSPFYLTSGKNVGLLVIITLNTQEQPVLITSVHTCGCYLAFSPTSFLPLEALPAGWNKATQQIYGESLPGILKLTTNQPHNGRAPRTVVAIRGDTHRVMGITQEEELDLTGRHKAVTTPLLPMQALQAIAVDGTTTSFFETEGARKGYVKESLKPRERLLMSWWTIDWQIGEDKAYGPGVTGTTFYTSTKFWARDQSDMGNFPQFLRYWGWNL